MVPALEEKALEKPGPYVQYTTSRETGIGEKLIINVASLMWSLDLFSVNVFVGLQKNAKAV